MQSCFTTLSTTVQRWFIVVDRVDRFLIATALYLQLLTSIFTLTSESAPVLALSLSRLVDPGRSKPCKAEPEMPRHGFCPWHPGHSPHRQFPLLVFYLQNREVVNFPCANQGRNGQRCVKGTFSESVHLSHSVGREVFERLATQPTNLRLLKVLKHRWPGHGGVRNHQTINSQLPIHSRQDRSVTQPLCTVAKDPATIMLFVSTSVSVLLH